MKRLLSRDYSRKTGARRLLQPFVTGFGRFAPLVLMGFMLPSVLFGQKELIIALQRDMASLQDQMKNLQKGQDEKLAAIQAMLQQAVDGSKGVSWVSLLSSTRWIPS